MSDAARRFDQQRKDAAGSVASDVRARLREWYGVDNAALVSVESAKDGAYETGGEYDPITFLDYAGVDWLVDTNDAILPVGERIRPNIAGRRDFSWRVANGCSTPCESDRVPAGIEDGQTLRMDGEGAPAPGGGPRGDLLIDVSIADHPAFERDGDDLRFEASVAFPQVVFGDAITVPTVEGETDLEVPAGTQSGEEFRVRGEGMPRLRRRGTGDLYVTVQAYAEARGEEIDVDEGFLKRIASSF